MKEVATPDRGIEVAHDGLDGNNTVDTPARDAAEPDMNAAETGIDGEVGCVSSSACDDHNACTEDNCVNGVCVYSPVLDGTPCNDGQLCTSTDVCQSGNCMGTSRTSAASVVATAYAFGGAYVTTDSDDSRCSLVAFASPDRLLFADRLDSDATLLTLTEIAAGTLRVVAQTVTDSILSCGSFSGWVWQTVPMSHLVALPNHRFAFFSDRRIQVFQVTTDGQLSEIWRANATFDIVYDAVWAGDSIWTCRGASIVRYLPQADGSLVETPAPDLANYQGCMRMAVAPDGTTVYASNPFTLSPGVFRWSASGGSSISSEVVLPGIAPIDMAVDDAHLALQRMGKEGDLGDTEVYRLSDFTRIAVFSEDGTSSPFSLALSNGKLFLEWMHNDAQSERVTGAVYDLGTDAAKLRNEWTIRTRSSRAADTWYPGVERLVSAGGRVVMQPWRHVVEIDATTGAPTWITGPGHGEIVGLQPTGTDRAASFSPYSAEQLDLSSGIRFSGGGMMLSSDVQRLQVVLPDDGLAPSSFAATPEAEMQKAETETVTVLRTSASAGLEVAGQFSLDGGPAKLVHRGNTLYQIAPVGNSDYRIRSFTLNPSVIGQSPLAAEAEYALTVPGVPSDWKRSSAYPYALDVDPDLGQIAITQIWRTAGDGGSPSSVVWASLRGASPTIIASAPLDSFAPPLLVRGGRLMLFDTSQATLYASDGTGGLTVVAQTSLADGGRPPLGVDGANRVYVTANYGKDLYVLSLADASVLSHTALPDAVRTATVVGDRLLLGATHSITVIEPTCGAPSVMDAGSDAAGIDGADQTVDADGACGQLAGCSDDGGLRQPALLGDINGDGCVDPTDLSLVISCFGKPVGDACSMSFHADVDGNGAVNLLDYRKVLTNQGRGCDGAP